MKNKTIVISLLLLIIYALVSTLFIFMYIPVSDFNKYIVSLNKVLTNLSDLQINMLVSVTLSVISIVSFLIQYVIVKFLFTIFSIKEKAYMYFALIPKLIFISLNIIFLLVFSIKEAWIFSFSALIATIFIFIYFYYKNKKIFPSILFVAPFIIDASISLIKMISKL